MTEEEKRKANAKYQRKFRKKNLRDTRKREIDHTKDMKMLVYNHYSKNNIQCNCCGEKEFIFLCLDHINNDGAEDRRNNPNQATGRSLYTRLIKNNFPDGFQLLCYNCNMSKAIHGKCPHKNEV